jgi:hypothetical protein
MKSKLNIIDQKGTTAVEFAIVLPLLVLLLFGIIEFSLLLYNKHIITNACREGVRKGIIVRNPRINNQQIKDEIKDYAASNLVTFGSDVLEDNDIHIAPMDDGVDPPCVVSSDLTDPNWYTHEERCLTFGSDLRVETVYTYNFLVLPFSIPLNNETIMKME